MLRCSSSGYKKAGLSGLFLLWFTLLSAAEPLALAVKETSVGKVSRTMEPVLIFKLTDESKQAFFDLTRGAVGKSMEVRIGGKPVMAPVIRDPVAGGSLQIANKFSEPQIIEMLLSLRSGSKIEVEIIEPPR